MKKALRFVVNIPIEDIDLGIQEGLSLDDISKKIYEKLSAMNWDASSAVCPCTPFFSKTRIAAFFMKHSLPLKS